MAWCPKCKNEYYEGIKVCADCGSELVDSLEEWEAAERAEKEAKIREQFEAFQEVFSEEAAERRALAEQMAENPEEAAELLKRQEAKTERVSVYQNYEEKAAENKSSAYTLLGVGLIGCVVCVLSLSGVIRLPVSESFRFSMIGMMGLMFVFFVVMGIVSMKNAGKYAKKAESERELTRELEKWFVEHVTAEKIDDGLFTEEEASLSEEQKYFKRFERMKELLSTRFLNLNEGYADRFLDKHYQDIFG